MINYQDTMPMFREYGLPLMVFMDGKYDKVDFRNEKPRCGRRKMRCT